MNDTFQTYETAWCPGCGNFSILEFLKTACEQLGKKPHEVLIAAGIGQAAKLPQYINVNSFCGLHGRGLSAAVGAKIANEDLTVIVSTGDGDSYGEGGNHFIHNIRRNVDVTHFVHDNQVYGLTKGQSSPTSDLGHLTDVQTTGNINPPLNPLLLAVATGAGFVARAFSGDKEHLTEIMKKAISYKGYALVDILQPCVSFNKVNTYGYYSERVYRLDETYNSADKAAAFQKAMEYGERIPIGIIYQEQKETFHEKNAVLKKGIPLVDQTTDPDVLNQLIRNLS